MITPADLKRILHRDHGRLSKVLAILAASGKPTKVADIMQLGADAGFRRIRDWNVSSILATSRGKAILIDGAWEITDDGMADLVGIIPNGAAKPPLTVAVDLRAEMGKLTDPITIAFVDEAVRGFEAGVHRSAVVMSWLAAVDVLYNVVLTTKLAEFNALALKQNKKWEAATDRDGLAVMKEFTFLERAETIGIIDKNTKHALDGCLKRRNAAGHPNTFKIGPHAVAGHIETLIQNVFQKYGPPAP